MEETPQAGIQPAVSCALELVGDDVRFLLDEQVVATLARAAYRQLQKSLAESPQFDLFPLEGTAVKLRLPPLDELEAGRVPLDSDDGLLFGRRYKLLDRDEENGRWVVTLGVAGSGAVAEKMAWDAFTDHVRAGRCRGLTPYRALLGEYNERLYFSIMGKHYQAGDTGQPAPALKGPALPAPVAPPASSPETAPVPAPEPEPAAEEEPPAPPEELAPWRLWLREHPKFAAAAAGIGLLVLLLSGIIQLARGPSYEPPILDFRNPRSVDHFLDENVKIARVLLQTDFREYAHKHPKAALDNLQRLKDFARRAEGAPLSADQKARLAVIKEAVPRLQEQLQR